MRTTLLFVALLLTVSATVAQISKQDSTRIRELLKEARGEDSLVVSNRLIKQAITIARKAGDNVMEAESYIIGAIVNFQHSQYDKAWTCADSTIILYGRQHNEAIAYAITMKAAIKSESGDLPQALALYLQAVDEYLAIDYTVSAAKTITTVALAYHNDIKDYTLGLKYARQAYKLLRAAGTEENKVDLWRAINAIAINFDDAGVADSALYYHELNRLSNPPMIYLATTLNNIGNTLLKKGKLKEARTNFTRALGIHRTNPDPGWQDYDFATVFNNLSDVACALGETRECEILRDSAVYYSIRSKNSEKLLDAYRDGYLNTEKQGDFQRTVFYLKRYMGLKDSLYTTEKAKALSDLQVRYETKEKEQEISLLRAEGELSRLQLQQSRYVIAGIIGIVCLGALALFFQIRRKQEREKVLKVLEEEKRQRREFAAMLNAEEQERSRVAKELHDGIGQLLSVAKLNVSSLAMEKGMDEKILSNAMEVIDQAATEVRAVSHNLMPALLSTIGLRAALNDFSSRMNMAKKMTVNIETSDVAQSLQKETEISLYRIIQEITNNVIKHSKASSMHIRLYENNGLIELLISDNGVGLSPISIEQSTGIGWKNIFSRVTLLNGKLDMFATTEFQTNIRIRIPYPPMTISA